MKIRTHLHRRAGTMAVVRWVMVFVFAFLPGHVAPGAADGVKAPEQYILVNFSHGAESYAKGFAEVRQAFPNVAGARRRVGVGAIFSYLNQPRDKLLADLRQFLDLAAKTDTPVIVQLDGENWWGARPDLWNWWDPSRPGYDPANRANVEWTGWGPEYAIKIAWRNWGRQIRVLPPPNLMSPRYREACRGELQAIVPVILQWWHHLPAARRDLFVGIKVGWESSIGVNAWYYPNGDDLLNRPASEDPTYGLKVDEIPGRGVTPIGYAAVSTAGLRHSGELTEADLAEVVRRHLSELCHELVVLGVPRDRLFTHCGGWKPGELLYASALNPDSCPGWSFYRHAADPTKDIGVQRALQHSDAPYWAAVEWLYQGPRQVESWKQALTTTLVDPHCRYLCIYNWEGIRGSDAVLKAIRQVTAGGSSAPARLLTRDDATR